MDEEYTGNDRKYKQLSAEERGKVEACCLPNCSISKTAGLINRLKSRSYEEINAGNTRAGTQHALLETERKRRK